MSKKAAAGRLLVAASLSSPTMRRRVSAASGDSWTLDPHALRARVPLSMLAPLT